MMLWMINGSNHNRRQQSYKKVVLQMKTNSTPETVLSNQAPPSAIHSSPPSRKAIHDEMGDRPDDEIEAVAGENHGRSTPENFKIKEDLGLLSTSATLTRLFDKISLQSKNHQKEMPKRFTIPNPFHLLTEDRGIEKEKHFSEKILQKHLEEQRALIPKANPYPYSTDYPEIPYKPEPKECTQPKLFKLESLVRHEESMQRIAEEVQQIKKLESQRRNFKAQSMRDFGVIRLPERQKKPLTEIQEFSHHVDHRAVDREEFDKKIKEKEMTYKRLREKYETEKMIEEEEAVKKMRRTMVHHARPLPKFDNPFVPQTSTREATKALSPDLLVRRRGERCHAYHMR